MHKLQSAQNSLTRVVLSSLRHLSASERLSYLHWLPVNYRIQNKIATLTYKTLATCQPSPKHPTLKTKTPTFKTKTKIKTKTKTKTPTLETKTKTPTFKTKTKIKTKTKTKTPTLKTKTKIPTFPPLEVRPLEFEFGAF